MKNIFWVFLFSAAISMVSACKKNSNNDLNNLDCSKINATYSANIKPIISDNCLSSGCHNTGSINGDFTTYEGLKAKADNGSLDARVIQEKTMPLNGSLTMDELQKIKCWLNSGAQNN